LTYQYNIFGLKANSSHKLGIYPIKTFSSKPDVLIERGKIDRPNDGLERTIYKPFSVLNKDLFYLEVPNIAKFLITGKKQLTIEKLESATWQDVHAFLFDNVFILLLLRNGIFLLHASAVTLNNKAYMFCGTSGIGKSTLAASLASKKGAKIIEDDKCLMLYNPKVKKFQIINQFPFLELWEVNSKLAANVNNIHRVNKVRQNIQKFRFSIAEHSPKQRKTIDKIVLLTMTNEESPIEIKELKGIQKVTAVKNHIHMDHYVTIFGMNKEAFQNISKIVNGVSVHVVHKSRNTKLPEFLDFIEKEIVE